MFTVQLLAVQSNVRLYESHRSTPGDVELQFFSDIEDEDGGASRLRHVSKVVAEKDDVRLVGGASPTVRSPLSLCRAERRGQCSVRGVFPTGG